MATDAFNGTFSTACRTATLSALQQLLQRQRSGGGGGVGDIGDAHILAMPFECGSIIHAFTFPLVLFTTKRYSLCLIT